MTCVMLLSRVHFSVFLFLCVYHFRERAPSFVYYVNCFCFVIAPYVTIFVSV